MLTRREMLNRLHDTRKNAVPMTNYGLTIAYLQGVLDRCLTPFPVARAAWQEAIAEKKDATCSLKP
jgi:hypothetical protein